MDLTVELYKTTQSFPSEEKFGLTSQIRRAASSIPANIAEGHARGRKEYQQFLRIAAGSLTELETHLMISQRVGFLTDAKLEETLSTTEQLGRMLNKLRSTLSQSDA
jgi:four helix bundle protein